MAGEFEIVVDLDRIEEDNEIKWRPGIRSGANADEAFIVFLTGELVTRFKNAIRLQQIGSRSMKDLYVPLSPKYVLRKEKKKLMLGFWQATGQIMNYIQWKKIGDRRYTIGWDRRIMYREPAKDTNYRRVFSHLSFNDTSSTIGKLGKSTGVKVWFIVKTLEFGPLQTKDGRLQNGRPLIRPLLARMRRDVLDLYFEYLRSLGYIHAQ